MAPTSSLRLSAIRGAKAPGILAASAALLLVALITLVFKAVSTAAWAGDAWHKKIDYEWTKGKNIWLRTRLGLVDMGWGPTGTNAFNTHSDVLIFVAAAFGFFLALFTIFSVLYTSARGPIHGGMKVRSTFYLVYYTFTVYTLIIFVYLTVTHYQSARFKPSAIRLSSAQSSFCPVQGGRCISYDNPTVGYDSDVPFDLETWTCDLRSTGFVLDPSGALTKTCVGEAGSRWALLPLLLVGLTLSVLMEMDRRGARRFVQSRKMAASGAVVKPARDDATETTTV